MIVNRFCKLGKKKKKKKKKKTEKKKKIKNVTQSNQLVHFCLMMSGAFCTDEPGRVGQL